jgi:hypothetical protein
MCDSDTDDDFHCPSREGGKTTPNSQLRKAMEFVQADREHNVDVIIGYEKGGVEYHYELMIYEEVVGCWRWWSLRPDDSNWDPNRSLPWLIPGASTCDEYPIYVQWSSINMFFQVAAPSLLVSFPNDYTLKFIGFTPTCRVQNDPRVSVYVWKADESV